MTTSFDKHSSTLGKLTISIDKADYQPAVDKKLKEYSKKAVIKGFRPGFAPVGMIQKMYGKSILYDEVIEVVNSEINNHIKSANLKIVGEPLPTENNAKIDWDNQTEPFVFEFDFGFSTDFSVDLNTISANKYTIEPDDEKVNESIEQMRKQMPITSKPESSLADDIIFGKLTQESSSFSLETAIPLDKVKEESVFKFTGLELGSKVTFDIQSIFEISKSLALATSLSEEDAVLLAGDFEFEITDITRQEIAELNQEFFDRSIGEGKATNLEEYQTEVKGILRENYNRESNYVLEVSSQNALLNQANIELPDEFLKKWLFDSNEGKFTKEQIENEYHLFARSLRLDLIFGEISEQNKEAIDVQMEDIVEEGRKEIRGYFGGSSYAGMEEFIDKMARDMIKKGAKDAQANMRKFMDAAFKTKVNQFITENISKNESIVSVDQFKDIADNLFKEA